MNLLKPVILVIAGFVVLEIPRLILRNSKQVSGYDLADAVPWGGDIRWAYPVIVSLWTLVMLVVHVFLAQRLEASIGIQAFGLFGSWAGSLAVVEGLFAMLTGVVSTSTRFANRYVYENGQRNRRIGLLELIAGLTVMAISIIYVTYSAMSSH